MWCASWLSVWPDARVLPNARKPRLVLIEFSFWQSKSTSSWRCSNSCRRLVNRTASRDALLTLTSKLWKERATSLLSQTQFYCTAATTRHVLARRIKQTLFHLLHSIPVLCVFLVAFTAFFWSWCIWTDCLLSECFLQAMSTWPFIYCMAHFLKKISSRRYFLKRNDIFWSVLSDLNKILRCLLMSLIKHIKLADSETDTASCKTASCNLLNCAIASWQFP